MTTVCGDLFDFSDEAPSSAPRPAAGTSAGPGISVEIAGPERFAAIEPDWTDLVRRALTANVFLEPAIVAAAAARDGPTIDVLLVWSAPTLGRAGRLIGVWAFARRRALSLLPLPILKTPVHDHAFLGNPVLDRDAAAEALSGMLDAVVGAPTLPKILSVGNLDADGPTAAIIEQVLTKRGSRWMRFEIRHRPVLLKTEDGGGATPISTSRAKALRQKRRRLASQGVITCTHHQAAHELDAVIETFFALEASGWKARRTARGQAILCTPSVAAFFKLALLDLAARSRTWITALRVDGRAVAMQITVRSGDTAFTWKTAYDERLRACAPGFLLHQEVTGQLLAETSLDKADSCNQHDSGYMAEFWSGRRAVSDLIVDLRPVKTTTFPLICGAETLRRRLLALARSVRSLLREWRRRLAPLITARKSGEEETNARRLHNRPSV